MVSPPLDDLKVSGYSMIPIICTDGHVNQPMTSAIVTVWAQDTASVANDGDGSIRPLAVQLPLTPPSDNRWAASIQVEVTIDLPKPYPLKSTVQLIGTLRSGKTQLVLESAKQDICRPSIQPGKTSRLLFDKFSMTPPFGPHDQAVPFRAAGDFVWHLKNLTHPDKTKLDYGRSTRLELFWLSDTASAGPSWTDDEDTATKSDLQGCHSVSFLRLLIPSYFAIIKQGKLKPDRQQWWINHVASVLQALSLKYNTISGRSAFGVGCSGGTFDLDLFLDQKDKSPLVNSFDLCALIDLGFDLVVTAYDQPVTSCEWAFKAPFGKVVAGEPFGLSKNTTPAITPKGVNNPFFHGRNHAASYEHNKENQDPCAVRAWLEVKLPQRSTRMVVDLAWAAKKVSKSKNQATLATLSRNDFLKAQILPPRPLSDFANHDRSSAPGGQVFVETSFIGPTDQVSRRKTRLGVHDVGGLHVSKDADGRPRSIVLPTSLETTIASLIETGRNLDEPFMGFNDASLREHHVTRVLKSVYRWWMPEISHKNDYKVAPDVTKVSYTYTNMPVTGGLSGKLDINIHIYDSLPAAFEALVCELSRYESNVSKSCSALEKYGPGKHIGHVWLSASPFALVLVPAAHYPLEIISLAPEAQRSEHWMPL
ncbi:hypothetical protein KVT40_007095 [Elsinoe batatas]|uniref:Uncharacterized protein n=1 Tax=Elsinoe batatas TaxID=2601811 RepID=A0A8K0KYY4_9PEZI|nr:hypothetical protein KVT40_007095 [Elsinoe batatas]